VKLSLPASTAAVAVKVAKAASAGVVADVAVAPVHYSRLQCVSVSWRSVVCKGDKMRIQYCVG